MQGYFVGAGRFGTVKKHPTISFLVVKECIDERECEKELRNIQQLIEEVPHCIFPPLYQIARSKNEIIMYGCEMNLFGFLEKGPVTPQTLQYIISEVEAHLRWIRCYDWMHRDCHVGNVMLCNTGVDCEGRMPVVYLIDGTYLHKFSNKSKLPVNDCRRPEKNADRLDFDYDLALFSYSCHAYFRFHFNRFPELPRFSINERALVSYESYVNNRHQWSLSAPGGENSLYLPSMYLPKTG